VKDHLAEELDSGEADPAVKISDPEAEQNAAVATSSVPEHHTVAVAVAAAPEDHPHLET
jgi:hypothetical protein